MNEHIEESLDEPDMIDFLKAYSKVDNKFIDDFFGMYDRNNNYNFLVNLEIVADWLGTKKGKLKQTLINTYTENNDYIVIQNIPTNKKKPRETILLTPKCFKTLSILSGTKKAEEVREYYFSLEDLIQQYKNHIIESMNKKIKQLKNNQKPKINIKRGVIYIFRASDDIDIYGIANIKNFGRKLKNKMYKMGKSKNLPVRSNAYNSDKADDVIPLFVYETDDIDAIESCVKIFAKKYQYRKHKEIYEMDINVLKNIIASCGETNNKLNLKTNFENAAEMQGGSCFMALYYTIPKNEII
jgi:phage anti-repressor protein